MDTKDKKLHGCPDWMNPKFNSCVRWGDEGFKMDFSSLRPTWMDHAGTISMRGMPPSTNPVKDTKSPFSLEYFDSELMEVSIRALAFASGPNYMAVSCAALGFFVPQIIPSGGVDFSYSFLHHTNNDINAIAFNQDSSIVAFGGRRANVMDPGFIALYSVDWAEQELTELQFKTWGSIVRGLSLTDNLGMGLIAISCGNTLEVYPTENFIDNNLRIGYWKSLNGFDVSFNDWGDNLAVASNVGPKLHKFRTSESDVKLVKGFSSRNKGEYLAFGPDDFHIVVGNDSGVSLMRVDWKEETLEEVVTEEVHDGVDCLAFTPSKDYLVVGSGRKLHVYKVKKNQ